MAVTLMKKENFLKTGRSGLKSTIWERENACQGIMSADDLRLRRGGGKERREETHREQYGERDYSRGEGGCEAKPGRQTRATKAKEAPWASSVGPWSCRDVFLSYCACSQSDGPRAVAKSSATWLLSLRGMTR